jgi:tellurite resistance protein TehA-like permease
MVTSPDRDDRASGSKPKVQQQEQKQPIRKIGMRERLKHFTFAWFLSTMSTGGLALAIAETPHQFSGTILQPFFPPSYTSLTRTPGLYHIGLTIFFVNIFLFLLLCTCTTLRIIYHRAHFLASFVHPQESFFLGSFWLSLSVILAGIQTYGITHGPAYPWLVDLVYVLYWIYAACSLANSVFQYWVLIQWSEVRPVPSLPSIFLAGYSAMLTGTVASMVAGTQPDERAVSVIVSGVAYQGSGWCISFITIVGFVRNVLDNGFPPPQLRPALFIPVGSGAYTIVALIGLANAIPESADYFARHPAAPEILRVLALFTGVFLYVFSFWLFAIAFLGNVGVVGRMPFSLTWWAFIFPNVGFTLSTSVLGKELESEGILWVASVMTILLVLIWLVTVVGCVRAVWKRQIVWPGRDEDRNR